MNYNQAVYLHIYDSVINYCNGSYTKYELTVANQFKLILEYILNTEKKEAIEELGYICESIFATYLHLLYRLLSGSLDEAMSREEYTELENALAIIRKSIDNPNTNSNINIIKQLKESYCAV